MAENKKSFVAYCDWLHTFEALPDEQAGKLAKHLFQYVNDLDPKTDDILINAVFANIKMSLKRDLKKYEERAERSRNNGSKGGRPRRKQAIKPSGLLQNPNEPEKPDSVNDNVNDSDNVSTKVDVKNKAIALQKKQENFYEELVPFVETFGKEIIREFFNYWSEPNKSKTKMRCELEKTWDTKRRLTTWKSNDEKRHFKSNSYETNQRNNRHQKDYSATRAVKRQ